MNSGLIVVAFLGSVWLLSMSAIALRESIHRPSESYRNFVKYFAGISIASSVALIAAVSYYTYLNVGRKRMIGRLI